MAEGEKPIQDQIAEALGELANNEHILNFHTGVAALPEWLTSGDLKVILGVGDMNHEDTKERFDYGRVGTEFLPNFDVYVCYPWIEYSGVTKRNLEYILANSPRKKVICYLDIENPDHVTQFVALFAGRVGFLTSYRSHCPHFGIESIGRLLRKGGEATEVFEFYDRFFEDPNTYLDRLDEFYKKTISGTLTNDDKLSAYGNLGDHSYGNRGWLDLLPHTSDKGRLIVVIQQLVWCYMYLYRMNTTVFNKLFFITRPLEMKLEELFDAYKDGIPYPPENVTHDTIRLLSYCVKSVILAEYLPEDMNGSIKVHPDGDPKLVLRKFGRMNGGRRTRKQRRLRCKRKAYSRRR